MSKVAYPSMKRLGYSDSLSTGVIAAGGTLGIMIPPSTIMVIYGIVTETNIGKLFAAGVIPGILTAILLMVAVVVMTLRDPEHAPAGERFDWAERWRALRGIWGVLLLVIVVLGGIYGGIFTATEGAGIGAAALFEGHRDFTLTVESGPIGGTPGSPTPVGCSVEAMMWTSTSGISASRSTS